MNNSLSSWKGCELRSTLSFFLCLACVTGGHITPFPFIGGSGLRGPSAWWNCIGAGSTAVHHRRSSQYQRRHSFSKILQRSRPHESGSRLRLWRRPEAVPYFCSMAEHRYRGSPAQLSVNSKMFVNMRMMLRLPEDATWFAISIGTMRSPSVSMPCDGLQSRSSRITSCPGRIEHYLLSEGDTCVPLITKHFLLLLQQISHVLSQHMHDL